VLFGVILFYSQDIKQVCVLIIIMTYLFLLQLGSQLHMDVMSASIVLTCSHIVFTL